VPAGGGSPTHRTSGFSPVRRLGPVRGRWRAGRPPAICCSTSCLRLRRGADADTRGRRRSPVGR